MQNSEIILRYLKLCYELSDQNRENTLNSIRLCCLSDLGIICIFRIQAQVPAVLLRPSSCISIADIQHPMEQRNHSSRHCCLMHYSLSQLDIFRYVTSSTSASYRASNATQGRDGGETHFGPLIALLRRAAMNRARHPWLPRTPKGIFFVGTDAQQMDYLIPHLVMIIEENIYQQICSRIINITCTRDTAIYMGKPSQCEE